MPVNKNSFWVKFEEFGYYYRIKGGLLKQAPISQDGSVDIDNKTILTKLPEDFKILDFTNKINQELGTNFQY